MELVIFILVYGNSKLGVTPRSLYAGIGDDRYGQFFMGLCMVL